MNHPEVLSSRVRLARNYEDLPFDAARPGVAAACVSRTANAMALSGEDKGFALLTMASLGEDRRDALVESRLISGALAASPESAVLLREEDRVSVMMGEEDHLRIQAITDGLALNEAASRCFAVEDALSRHVRFAFDPQLGYLTAWPTDTGTGMRASLLMHLPMLTHHKQMGSVGQIAAKVGLNARGYFGEGSEALGDVFQISSQMTLGRTEAEVIATVTALAEQLSGTEAELRRQAMAEKRTATEDRVFRAWGILMNARILPLREFYGLWSSLRLGAVLGLVPVPPEALDALPVEAQDAHLRAYNEKPLTGEALDAARAARVHEIILAARKL